jgi:NADH:ubiquinone oxidoreductase subunit 3 (subunit A)
MGRKSINKHTPENSKSFSSEKTMKLNMLFIVMDLLTLLAYPIIFVYSKLYQFSNRKTELL